MSSLLETPGLREALRYGGKRADWSRVFDEAASLRHDESVLRVLEQDARREELRRENDRRLLWCAPAPAAASIARPHIFRALFRRDVGGVAASDVWFDADFIALDGVSGKLQSWIDYIDYGHVCAQSNGAYQVPTPIGNFRFAQARTALFSGAEVYSSNRSSDLWAYIGDGSGSTTFIDFLAAVGTETSRVLISSTTAAQVHGINVFCWSGSLIYSIAKQGSATAYIPQSATAGILAGVHNYFELREGSNLQPTYAFKISQSASIDGSYGNTPDQSPAGCPLNIGGNIGLPVVGWVGDIRSVHAFRRILNDAERLVWQQRTKANTGIPS